MFCWLPQAILRMLKKLSDYIVAKEEERRVKAEISRFGLWLRNCLVFFFFVFYVIFGSDEASFDAPVIIGALIVYVLVCWVLWIFVRENHKG